MGFVVAIEGMLGDAAGPFEAALLVPGLITGGELEADVAADPTRGALEARAALLAAETLAGAAPGPPARTIGGALIIPLDAPQLIENASIVTPDTRGFHRTRNGPDASMGSPEAKCVPRNRQTRSYSSSFSPSPARNPSSRIFCCRLCRTMPIASAVRDTLPSWRESALLR